MRIYFQNHLIICLSQALKNFPALLQVNSVIHLKMHMKNNLYYKPSGKKLVLLLLKLPSPLCYLIRTFVYTVKQSEVRTATKYVQS